MTEINSPIDVFQGQCSKCVLYVLWKFFLLALLLLKLLVLHC